MLVRVEEEHPLRLDRQLVEGGVALAAIVVEATLGYRAAERPRDIERFIRAIRVEDEDLPRPATNGSERLRDILLLVVRQDDNGDIDRRALRFLTILAQRLHQRIHMAFPGERGRAAQALGA